MGAARRILLVAVLGTMTAAVGCGTARSPSVTRPGAASAAETGGGQEEEGMASYYAPRFSGRRTASGESYNPRDLTAAHRRLPFGTHIRVTRDDGRSVVVRVNDRGPHSPGRILDVSEAAARELGMMRAGVIRVRVRPVSH